MYVCLHAHTHVYIHIIYIYIYLHTCIHTYTHIIHFYMCTHYPHTHTHIHIYIYIYIYIYHTHTRTHIYIYTSQLSMQTKQFPTNSGVAKHYHRFCVRPFPPSTGIHRGGEFFEQPELFRWRLPSQLGLEPPGPSCEIWGKSWRNREILPED